MFAAEMPAVRVKQQPYRASAAILPVLAALRCALF